MKKIRNILLLLIAVGTSLIAARYDSTLDVQKWKIYDASPAGANISNVQDAITGTRVISLKGDALNNGYMFGHYDVAKGWNNKQSTKIMWGARFSENFVVYISVTTTKGHRYIYYTPSAKSYGKNGDYVHHGLGAFSKDGNWHGFERDLALDLNQYEKGNTIISVDGFLVRGSGFISEVKMQNEQYSNNVVVSQDGNKVLSTNGNTISVLRINALNDRPLATFSTKGKIVDIELSASGNKLLVLHSNSLEIYDISTSYAPYLLNTYSIVENALAVSVDDAGEKAYISIGKNGVVSININL